MEKLFIYLTNLSGNIAYLLIFGILLACGLGFPLPEDIPLIAAGYLCWDGTLEWMPTLLITLLGVLAGDTLLFFLGNKLGLAMIKGQKMFKPEKVRRTKAYFRKYGYKIIFFARFVAGIRAVVFFMAGAMKLKFSRFILLDGLAALLSVPVWILIGYGLGYKWGEEISRILISIKHLKTGFTIFILLIVAIVCLKTYLRYRRGKSAA